MFWTRRKKIAAVVAGVAIAGTAAGLFIAASVLSRRFEPFIREQAVAYLSERFQSDVELGSLAVKVPKTSPIRLWQSRGKGAYARIEGERMSMRQSPDRPALFAIGRFSFEVELGSLWERKPFVRRVILDQVEIHIPPKGERPRLARAATPGSDQSAPKARIDDVLIRDARLVLLPKDKAKTPLQFQISRLKLEYAGEGKGMQYQSELVNAKPPGHIKSAGTFGPWVATDPGDTPLRGAYTFRDAKLDVFAGIAGTLESNGEFDGSLSALVARGEAYVPDFRLKMSGNRVPLRAKFDVLVDGTNGNTTLKPVRATLGSTSFTTSGGIIKHDGDKRRTISLDVSMPRGHIRDLLRLATKGDPFMEGFVALNTRIDIPPLSGKVREKLVLDGRFNVSDGKFLKSNIQDQIDTLSRRGMGQPKNQSIDEVVSGMTGKFRLDDEVLTFQSLTFGVPGANIDLAGFYNLDTDVVDFHGALKLDAKVSQTMSGWKRWALKPVDPLFAKNGVGTFLRIQVEGTSKQPKFGRERGHGDEAVRARTVAVSAK